MQVGTKERAACGRTKEHLVWCAVVQAGFSTSLAVPRVTTVLGNISSLRAHAITADV